MKKIRLRKLFCLMSLEGSRLIFLWHLWHEWITGPLLFFSYHRTLVAGFLNLFSLFSQSLNEFVDFLGGVWLKGVLDWRNVFMLLSLDFVQFLLLFLGISHFVGLLFLFFQNRCVLIGCLFCNRNGLNDIFVNDIELVILMHFLNFLLILLEFEFGQILLLNFLL